MNEFQKSLFLEKNVIVDELGNVIVDDPNIIAAVEASKQSQSRSIVFDSNDGCTNDGDCTNTDNTNCSNTSKCYWGSIGSN